MRLNPGTRLGPYEILSTIGAGGMGEVYRARDTRLGRDVAIKVVSDGLADDPRIISRFEREARAVASLSHPNIVALYDVGTDDGLAFAVMELLDGQALERRLGAEGLSWTHAVAIAASVADALACAHERGIVHRDLKPANIFLARDGIVKVLDFGLARNAALQTGAHATVLAGTAQTEPGLVFGTVGYMAPEQVRGEPADSRSDIFSLGCVLYEMLAGRPPFGRGNPQEVLAAILRDVPPALQPHHAPPQVIAVVERCLEKQADRRFQSTRDLAFALRQSDKAAAGSSAARTTQQRPRLQRLSLAAVLVAVGTAVGAMTWWSGRSTATVTPGISAIAVLPLQNLSGDSAQEYFSDGLTEELIARLAQVRSLKVISRTSAMRYKAVSKPLPEIGRELGVDAIVEGSVRRAGGHVRVTAQLIRAETDAHLWARDFESSTADVLEMQADIAEAIVKEIRAQVTPAESQVLTATRHVNPAAYEHYMLGRYYMWQVNPASWKRAIAELEEAIQLQSDYAPAHAMLSITWARGRGLGFTTEEGAVRMAAQRAVMLDPTLAEAHSALAQVKFSDWDWNGSEAEFATAYRLNRDSIDVCGCYGVMLSALGRFSDAIRIASEGALANPLSTDARGNYGFVLYHARQYAEAARELERALELEPRALVHRIFLARSYAALGRPSDGLAVVDRQEFSSAGTLGAMYALVGRRDDALMVLQRIGGRSALDMATVYAALGDHERTIEWLTRSVDARQPPVRWINVAPAFDFVHEDPRFAALVARMNLPSPQRLPAPTHD